MNLHARAGRKRAIVLITTLAIMTFMLMLAAMLVTTGVSAQRRAAFYFWSSAAHEAAVAGAVFAQTALQSNLGWMVTSQSIPSVSTTCGNLQVTQDFAQQTVQGFIFSQTNNVVSEFRISFNSLSTFPNDGRAAGYVSRNNMLNDVAFPYNNGAMSRAVPKRTAEVLVEGITRAATDGTVLARRVVEVGLYRAPFMPAASSGGTIQVNVEPSAGQWKLQVAAGVTSVPSIRSMGNVELYANDASQFSTTIGSPFLSNTGREFVLRDPTTGQAKATMGAQLVNPGDNAQQIALTAVTFDQVKAPTVRGTLPAGTYVYWDASGSTPSYYKDLSYNPTDPSYRYIFDATDQSVKVVDQQGNTVGSHVPSGNASQPYSGFWGGSMSVNLSHSVDVAAQSYQQGGTTVTNNNVAILAAPSITNRVNFQFASGQGVALQNSNSGGSITLRGDVSGAGSVVAKGDIVFEGHSTLSPNPDAVVTMYSGGSTTLSPILNQVASVDPQTVDVNSAAAATIASPVSVTPTQQVLGAFTQAMQAYMANPGSKIDGEDAGDCGLALVRTASGTTVKASAINGDMQKVVRKIVKDNLGEPAYKDVICSILGLPSGSSFNDAQRDAAITQALQSFASSDASSTFIWNLTQRPDGTLSLNAPVGRTDTPSTGNTATPTTLTTAAASVPDQEFRGLIYACKNFTTRLPPTANVSLQGAIVAYGGDPSRAFNVNDTSTWPGYDGSGQMVFAGKNVTFTYDPTYLGGLYSLFPAGALNRSFFASF